LTSCSGADFLVFNSDMIIIKHYFFTYLLAYFYFVVAL
jgi:hypothetical protein